MVTSVDILNMFAIVVHHKIFTRTSWCSKLHDIKKWRWTSNANTSKSAPKHPIQSYITINRITLVLLSHSNIIPQQNKHSKAWSLDCPTIRTLVKWGLLWGYIILFLYTSDLHAVFSRNKKSPERPHTLLVLATISLT